MHVFSCTLLMSLGAWYRCTFLIFEALARNIVSPPGKYPWEKLVKFPATFQNLGLKIIVSLAERGGLLGYWGKSMWKYQGSIKKELEVPSRDVHSRKANHLEFPCAWMMGVVVFYYFPGKGRGVTQLNCRMNSKLIFSIISKCKGKVANVKIPGSFFQKSIFYLNTPYYYIWIFSGQLE